MSEEFYRLSLLPPYVIAETNAMRTAARSAGDDIIDLGMGNPDLPPPPHVIAKLVEVALKPNAHGYSQSKGIPGLRRAQADYYARRFGVTLEPDSQVVVTMGSKEGLASLASAIIAPGDLVAAPDPSYPIHTFGFIMAGAEIAPLPTSPDDRYFVALEALAERDRLPKVIVVNYPSNPTAEVADLAFYARLVAFAKRHGIWIISDLAYAELYYDGRPTVSILQVEDAIDVAVEFTSLSKSYSMAGWRIGFAVGNKRLIEAMARIKSYLDYGAFTPIQAAACAALKGPQDIVAQNRELYRRRRDVLVGSFARSGWEIPVPCASMFAWAPIPPALAHLGSLEFSKQLLLHAKVAVAAGVGYGPSGEGYVRLALVENEQRIRQAARNIKRYLQSAGVNIPDDNKWAKAKELPQIGS
ncbi:LL-diaminopimelate aminotransferase [Sphingobium sp. H39-3-25]|uniref:LL-diaminopimelate aminotransferase n=1 Tax=Sphingobium arseniciresistens TaxID=3030834 RepID=UPI0023B9CACC|nr:LL-diaminopimelate aminotransferase [Sphingobium arseniciresistens]